MNIKEIIAEEEFPYEKDGKEYTSKIILGKPYKIENSDFPKWKCQLFIESFAKEYMEIQGMTSIAAIENAITIISTFKDYKHDRLKEKPADQPLTP